MAIFPVRLFGDPCLREKSQSIAEVDKRIRIFSVDMAKTMYDYKGVGLAAPQVGVLKQIITVDMGQDNYSVFVNPVIKEHSKATETDEEGCLSVPDVHVPINRYAKVVVEALDLKGRKIVIEADEQLARVLQHEIDHLNGLSILDKTDSKSRQKAISEFMENHQHEA